MRLFAKLKRDSEGATIIEFAVLAPVVIGMLIGVFQVGVSMQSYNALRSISSDTARYAVVEYQKKNEVTNTALETYAENLATSGAYVLQGGFDANVTDAATQRVNGAIEKELVVTYTPPALVPFVEWTSPQLTFTRPIFVIDE